MARKNKFGVFTSLNGGLNKIKELNHPNVESIHAIAIVENCLCIVCDEIDAPDIDAWLAGHSWEEESVLNLLKKLALTVHEIASKTNVIHQLNAYATTLLFSVRFHDQSRRISFVRNKCIVIQWSNVLQYTKNVSGKQTVHVP